MELRSQKFFTDCSEKKRYGGSASAPLLVASTGTRSWCTSQDHPMKARKAKKVAHRIFSVSHGSVTLAWSHHFFTHLGRGAFLHPKTILRRRALFFSEKKKGSAFAQLPSIVHSLQKINQPCESSLVATRKVSPHSPAFAESATVFYPCFLQSGKMKHVLDVLKRQTSTQLYLYLKPQKR